MALKPLGHRVLIRPDEQPEQSEGGLVLPQDHDHVSFSGTVVAVGKGSQLMWEVRQKAYERVLKALDASEFVSPDEAKRVRDMANSFLDQFSPINTVMVGDRVAFSAEAGLTFAEDGQQYLVMNEDDVVVLVEEGESAA